MKKLFTCVSLFVIGLLSAQNGINYKAVIKNDLGNVIANNSVDIKFKILESNALTNVYEESHSPDTDTNGIIIVNIGEGNVVSGIFNDISWGEDDHFLNVKIDTGSGFVDMGTTQFSAVPHAFHAKKAANVKGLEPIDEGNGVGWRLVDRNLDNYDNIGSNAIDLSFVDDPNLGLGATGSYAFSLGHNGTASGEHALAFGNQNYALNDYAIALGNNNNVTGLNSTAIGGINQVSGDYAFAAGLQNEASENYAVALGNNATASAEYAIAMGQNVTASGANSTALGRDTEAIGEGSFAIGINAEASEHFSTAIGYYSRATGYRSTSIGLLSLASGRQSMAMGYLLVARSFGETVIGSLNTPYTPNSTTEWNVNDRLFTVGNGNLSPDIPGYQSNAMTILKNGNVGIGTDTPQDLLHISGGRLRIGTETIEDTGSNQLSFGASLIPDANNAYRLGNSSSRWIGVWATDGTINTSDRRSKTNIASLNYGLKDILKLKPVSFNWKTNPNDDTKLGLIAQDLLKVIPEVVKTHDWETDEDGTKIKKELERMGVYYSDLIPVLIKAIQEQQKIITTQREENLKQTSELSSIGETLKTLLSRIETLESNSSNQLSKL